jgi:hypothetical protein
MRRRLHAALAQLNPPGCTTLQSVRPKRSMQLRPRSLIAVVLATVIDYPAGAIDSRDDSEPIFTFNRFGTLGAVLESGAARVGKLG